MKNYRISFGEIPTPTIDPTYSALVESQEVVNGVIVKSMNAQVVDNRESFMAMKSNDFSLQNAVASGVNLTPISFADTSLFGVDYQNNVMNSLIDEIESNLNSKTE